MEYFWDVVAALGAGIGTGLVGLSAAVVMVPILIVLCPPFVGGAGAYHATAIALCSDVLCSLATSLVYIRHKNINLKRCWLMISIILATSIAGSVAAAFVGNGTLGAFSLVLCVFIGIRFLIQPDPKPKRLGEGGDKLTKRDIAVSIFFGVAIGFCIGFVGSGGGLMMLLVFTMFLGMDRKTAVGTSTLVMTFTALIAFGSHAVMDSAIILERWDVLLICSLVATSASIASAQFANKVNNKVVGYVTGGILTALGIALLILNFVR